MKSLIPFFMLACCLSSSCDKAKEIAAKASATVEGQIAKQTSQSDDVPADPELRKLVDETPEGVIFRKDLPLPSLFEVRITRISESSNRTVVHSEIGSKAMMIKGTFTEILKLERAGEQVRYTLEQSTFTEPVTEKTDAAKTSTPVVLESPTKPCIFKKTGTNWKAETSEGFRAITLAKQLSPVFDLLLIDNAVAARPMWFPKERVKIGREFHLNEKALPILVAGNAKGHLKLKFKSIETVKGHPCGVFEITGNYSRKKVPDFSGHLSDENVTIQAGRIWLSLIYPLILREELDMIESGQMDRQSGIDLRTQGSARLSIIREWKKTGP